MGESLGGLDYRGVRSAGLASRPQKRPLRPAQTSAARTTCRLCYDGGQLALMKLTGTLDRLLPTHIRNGDPELRDRARIMLAVFLQEPIDADRLLQNM